MANEKEVDPELVKRADYAYNPHPICVNAPTEPGAPLSDDEKEQLRVPLATWMSGRLETGHLYIAINTVLARRNVRVAADALLGPVTDAEWFNQGTSRASLNAMIAARRARLLAPAKSATIQEQVERILTKHFKTIGVVDAAAEVIATLKQEGK